MARVPHHEAAGGTLAFSPFNLSDNYTTLSPDSPHFVPPAWSQREAVALFKAIAPAADEVTAQASDSIQFFGCGGNFERILCSECANEIDATWWGHRMHEEAGSGFPLLPLEMPCCRKRRTLNELIYQRPQGFARFSLTALNANIGDLSEGQKREFEQILGCRLRKILQRV